VTKGTEQARLCAEKREMVCSMHSYRLITNCDADTNGHHPKKGRSIAV
jgi:hypothetical protein